MIEWMQTHRKWLVITIWIATISFIGAGFVGWGQFQLNSKSNLVAKVEDTEVSVRDLEYYYNNLYFEYQKMLGSSFNQEVAKKLGLEKIALTQAVNNAILREYAKELGLYVTDKEVAQQILSIFKSKKAYFDYLNKINQKPQYFEEQLRKDLLVQKLLKLLNITPSNTMLLSMGSALYNEDNLSLNILNIDDIKVNITQKELKEFYNKNKNRYKSPEKYQIAFSKIYLNGEVNESILKEFYNNNKNLYKNEKGEILAFDKVKDKVKMDYLSKKMRKDAFIAYKKLKKGELNSSIETVSFNNSLISSEDMSSLLKNGYLKPVLYNNYYLIAKLIKTIKPAVLSFDDAKELVKRDLIHIKKIESLKNLSKQELKSFEGKNIGFISKDDVDKIPVDDKNIASQFLLTMFSLDKNSSYILLPQNNPKYSFIYKIESQKLLNQKKYKKNLENIKKISSNILNKSLINDIISTLKQKYSIAIYLKD